ncbi:NAD(P)-binding domain-containing protein [Fructobacillus sp. M2-14]|uniref:Pyrroline-5-carboxylate reductase n=1 Tax=Fructobacillus broussonetiae TaxID=2713173 RepID=A0ABS5QY89_9LACO|nr:pyrroline-5-carboxylate reductase dimerization domain-containing protein [Fructobacillus broussonetiae]MBS9338115.1 NAD(P)-binding domain-containing protein [Fructobacillus broussonetiae]
MKVGIVGLGHMGTALAKGLLNVSGTTPVGLSSNAKKAQELSIAVFKETNDFVSQEMDALILTVPAKHTVNTLEKLVKAGLSSSVIVMSAAAGVSAEALHNVSNDNPIYPFIPNIPSAINAGTTALAVTEYGTGEATITVKELLESLGDVLVVPEDQLAIAGTVGGCSPAFIDVMMDAMEDAAVAQGLDRSKAADLIASVVLGSAKLAQSSDLSTADLKGQITSPGGSTIKGVLALDANGFRHAIHEAIIKASGK